LLLKYIYFYLFIYYDTVQFFADNVSGLALDVSYWKSLKVGVSWILVYWSFGLRTLFAPSALATADAMAAGI